jgi:hypothetical protein
MTTIRAPLSTVLSTVRAEIEKEAKEAAGANTLLSKNEQGQLKDSITKTTADDIRAAGGPGTTVTVDKLVDAASSKMAALIGSVNQASGSGAASVSQAEVKALAAANPDAGVRVARAYELITGKSVSLDGIIPLPVPNDAVGELNAIHGAVVDFVKKELKKAAGTNDLLNATERASLPSGHLRDAAFATPPPRSVENVAAHLFNLIDPILADSGVDIVNLGRLDAAGTALMNVPFSRDSFFPLVAHDPEIAGLFADGVLATTGVRPDNIPGLPAPRFGNAGTPTPGPTPTPVPGALELHGVPGATGVVRLVDPAAVDAFVADAHALIDAMDYSRNGTITISEAESFVKRANNGYMWDPQVAPENRPRSVERAIYDIRESAYQRFGRPPTTTEVKEELVRFGDRAKAIGLDENNNPFDANGSVSLDDDIDFVILYDTVRDGGINLDVEPYVRFFDHEGDVAPTKRRPLDLTGEASRAIRNLVFHYNKAGNDNHWPLWSGVATSRYRLDPDEADQVISRILTEPVARQKEMFQAMVDWLQQDPNKPGLLYFNVDARHRVNELAIALGHPYRAPTGEMTAPSMPSP